MNHSLVDRIAKAVLYEGYILYPYRPSLKNRQRWTFGGLFPEAYCRSGNGDAQSNQTECLVQGDSTTRIEAVVRFLHPLQRSAGAIDPPLSDWPRGIEPAFRPVETLQVDAKLYHSWQEAQEREVALGETTLGELRDKPRCFSLSFPSSRKTEPVRDAEGTIRGILLREQQTILGRIEARAVAAAEGLFRLTLSVLNCTPLDTATTISRDAAAMHSLVSTHAILGVQGGPFVSLFDPPDCWREAAAACRNVGVWPVLVGEEGQADTMLSSPIILYDYPQVAPESPGDFFDGTEIDEMLTLRILTLTDEEKLAMASVDERARDLLIRTQELARGQMFALHGTIRPTGERTHG